jgi:hypothetical protein
MQEKHSSTDQLVLLLLAKKEGSIVSSRRKKQQFLSCASDGLCASSTSFFPLDSGYWQIARHAGFAVWQ